MKFKAICSSWLQGATRQNVPSVEEQHLAQSGTVSANRLCDTCQPVVDGYTTFLGLGFRKNSQSPPWFERPLVEIIESAAICWHCKWLLSVVANTWGEAQAITALEDTQSVKLRVTWISIHTHPKRNSGSLDGERQLNRVSISYGANPTAKEAQNVVFSKYKEGPFDVSRLLNHSHSLKWSEQDPYAGRIRPVEADCRLLKRWKECCLQNHGASCARTFMSYRVLWPRFVDVVDECIVQRSPDEVVWVALSYCWGGPQVHSLKTGNIDRYQQRGSLTEDILPSGIHDAMALTKALGERYIWIDSLCIVQDDDRDKLIMINAMGTIYAHALVTIINAANSQVSVGMPGISTPRKTQQVHKMHGFGLVEALDPPQQSEFDGYLQNTAWITRGWAFQEGLLSPRYLIVARNQVYWQCQTASWCEDSFWENVPSPAIYRHYAGSSRLRSVTDTTEEDWIDLYQDVLKAYSKRELTSESDRLGAVQAVLKVLSRSDEDGYFWGMPKGHMEMALSWASSYHNTRRDCDCKFIDANDEVVSCPFPSWSWLGWHGPSPMPTISNAIIGGRLGLRFYTLGRDGTPETLVPDPFVGPERDFTSKEYMKAEDLHEQIGYPRSLAHASIQMDKRAITVEDIPPPIKSSILAPMLLCFWTSTAVLQLEYQGWFGFHNCPGIKMSQGEVHFYGAWERNEDFRPSGEKKFIVVGTERTRMSHGGDVTLNLLLVEQDAAGVCYRQKLVTYVRESQWDTLPDKKWELVFLG